MLSNSITEIWAHERDSYKDRYILWMKDWKRTGNESSRGHVNECSYVLIEIFGLTSKEVQELDRLAAIISKDN